MEFNWFSTAEELEGGVSANLKLLSQFGLDSGVNLTQTNLGTVILEGLGGFSVFGSKGFAVAAPWSI